jgi:hypothetical protein
LIEFAKTVQKACLISCCRSNAVHIYGGFLEAPVLLLGIDFGVITYDSLATKYDHGTRYTCICPDDAFRVQALCIRGHSHSQSLPERTLLPVDVYRSQIAVRYDMAPILTDIIWRQWRQRNGRGLDRDQSRLASPVDPHDLYTTITNRLYIPLQFFEQSTSSCLS